MSVAFVTATERSTLHGFRPIGAINPGLNGIEEHPNLGIAKNPVSIFVNLDICSVKCGHGPSAELAEWSE